MATPSPWIQNLTWEEIKEQIEIAKGTIIIPVGSTEQHGPHLPVGTYTMVANTLADDAARQANILVSPPLWFGWSPHHMVLPYSRTMFVSYLFTPEHKRAAIVGLGCGAMIHFLKHHAPNLKLDVVEIDPLVIRVADEYFQVRSEGNVKIGRAHV